MATKYMTWFDNEGNCYYSGSYEYTPGGSWQGISVADLRDIHKGLTFGSFPRISFGEWLESEYQRGNIRFRSGWLESEYHHGNIRCRT